MFDPRAALVAVVDYGMGNLFSVKLACEQVGLHAAITSDRHEVERATAIILPGVGAFGSAMAALRRLDLVEPIKAAAAEGRPLVGICLGAQLLMSESHEFGLHAGLGLIAGDVRPLRECVEPQLKVPQVGWSQIHAAAPEGAAAWRESLLDGVADGAFMYFVHSFYCRPADDGVVLSRTRYGSVELCSSFRRGNVCGFQFHPERSGSAGLTVYRNLASSITRMSEEADARETRSALRPA